MDDKKIIHGIVFIQTWGESRPIVQILKNNNHVISVFHIMGRHSYMIDVDFDDKDELEYWIEQLKSLKLSSGVPAVIAIQSNKIIDIYKKKEDYTLKDYSQIKDRYHMFMMIDNPHEDERLISLLTSFNIVHTVLHVQGQHSFIAEIITENYGSFKDLLRQLKALDTVTCIETQEVINVPKYRNQIIDEKGNLVCPQEDIRELYML